MANLKDPLVRIQVLIQEDTKHGKFSDALYFTQDEFDALSDNDLKEKKKQRTDTWVADMDAWKNAPPPPEPTEEELLEQQAALEAQLAQIQELLSQHP